MNVDCVSVITIPFQNSMVEKRKRSEEKEKQKEGDVNCNFIFFDYKRKLTKIIFNIIRTLTIN